MAIVLRTELPGPRSRALMEARRAEIPRGHAQATPIFAARAHGALVEDVDGNILLDFASGIAVDNLGHTPERVVAAVKAQAEALLHSCFSVLPYEGYLTLATRLNRLTPGAHPKKTLLVNTGAEAVENAIKIARAHTGRGAVIAFDHAFHGRTLMAMSLTSKAAPYRRGFGPFAPEIYRAPFPYEYRSSSPDPTAECLSWVRDLVLHHIGSDQVAAVIIEPVLGEGGVIPAPPAFLRGLRVLCDAHRILLIADEIQTGFGRTGALFACEPSGVIPDLLITAKALGSGLPIAAVTGRAEIMDAAIPGALGGTFAGNPVSCAAALAVLDVFEASEILARARALGDSLAARLEVWKERYPRVGDVRGLGAMRGIELVRDRQTKEPDPEAARALLRHAYRRGVVALGAGVHENVVRLLVPLVISDDELAEGLAVIEEGLADIAS